MGKLSRKGIQFSIACVFANVTEVSIDNTGDLASSFAEELPIDIFPLTISNQTHFDDSVYTSLTIQQLQPIFSIPALPYIRSITVGDSCCTALALDPICIQDMPLLSTIVIGKNSYNRVKAMLKLQNLPRLESVTFQSGSFHDSTGILLNSVPSLQTLIFGDSTFCGSVPPLSFTLGIDASTTELVFSALSQLKTLEFGQNCFSYFSSLTVQSLPSLTSLLIKQGGFSGEKGSCSLSVTSCSMLTTITLHSGAFKNGTQFLLSSWNEDRVVS